MPPTIISSLFNGLKRARIRSRNVTSTVSGCDLLELLPSELLRCQPFGF
jgi:hypothetical protein